MCGEGVGEGRGFEEDELEGNGLDASAVGWKYAK
jgi:hypothetical protein